ncbi:MAG TPA: hypothetical protein VGN60_13420 [Devosia sp.]|jgi:hypothetical protein|nr:hypothetical protein [Devosia sp.]
MGEQPSFTASFASADVSVYPDRVETLFREDGSRAVADVHWGDADHIAAARHAGYGDDQYRMLVEHEIGHSFVADRLGWPHSWSLWSAAHGTGDIRPMTQWSPRVRDEEHLVVSLQRYANTGQRDPHARLEEAFGDALPAVARAFVLSARPWLAAGSGESGRP